MKNNNTESIEQQNNLKPIIRISKYGFGQEASYNLTKSTSWVNDLLSDLELELETDEHSLATMLSSSKLDVKIRIQKKHSDAFKEHLLLWGQITARYIASCVRCLEGAQQTIDVTFACCFLNPSMEELPQYHELTEIYCCDQQMELYYYHNGEIHLKDLIQEHIYLNTNPFPLHDEGCVGLCSVCGTNLNRDKCVHV